MAIRYRRNINCLSADQLHDVREAYQALYDLPEASSDSFATLGGLHGLPSPSWCDHGAPGFLTWHRAYMRAFEKALQTVHCDVMLPYWNWSAGPTTGVPAPCRFPTYVHRNGATVSNPLYRGPIASAAGGGTTSRRPDIDTTTFGDIATAAQSAMSNGTFADFQGDLNGPHGSVHVRTGGQMGSVARAGFDPIFFLHHCNVDRLWWNWQQSHPGAPMPVGELTHPLDPFNRPFTQQWQTGADVVSTDDLGYRYQNWCLVLPPIRVWELIPVWLEPIALRRIRNARLVVRADRMPMESVELRVFVGDEKAVADDSTERNPAFAGSIGLFGMGDVPMDATQTAEGFDVGLNLTDHLVERCAHLLDDHGGDDEQAHAEREVASGRTEHGDHGEHGGGDEQHADPQGHQHDPAERTDSPTLAVRVTAFTADGAALSADRAPFGDIELIVE